jgi:hypothetical protein
VAFEGITKELCIEDIQSLWSELNGKCTLTNSVYIEHTASQFRSVSFIRAEQCPSVQPAKGHETKNDRA